MSLSDCSHCWETPCSCGWDYIDWENSRIEGHIKLLKNVLEAKKEHPAQIKPLIYDVIQQKLD